MAKPILSVVIATFNSEKTLPLVLNSLQKQTYPKNKIEILIVDGGSEDDTLLIAERFNCRVIYNPRTEPVYGKYLGYLAAEGRYIMYLDHDEVIENQNSLTLKLAVFKFDKRIKAVISAGYRNPAGYPFVNRYINEFGDSFSFFIYRLSKEFKFFLPLLKRKYLVVAETKSFIIFDLRGATTLPLIELVAGGGMFDAWFFKKKFPEITESPELLPHLFYLLYTSGYPYIAVAKKDILIHYSAATLGEYLHKIDWRVRNNVFCITGGRSGFVGREKYQPVWVRFKKYLFIPYSFSLFFPLVDSLLLVFSRKRVAYLLHFPLCLYTASLIIFYYCLKILGRKPRLSNYNKVKKSSSLGSCV